MGLMIGMKAVTGLGQLDRQFAIDSSTGNVTGSPAP
jgi:hypothetical protein